MEVGAVVEDNSGGLFCDGCKATRRCRLEQRVRDLEVELEGHVKGMGEKWKHAERDLEQLQSGQGKLWKSLGALERVVDANKLKLAGLVFLATLAAKWLSDYWKG